MYHGSLLLIFNKLLKSWIRYNGKIEMEQHGRNPDLNIFNKLQ